MKKLKQFVFLLIFSYPIASHAQTDGFQRECVEQIKAEKQKLGPYDPKTQAQNNTYLAQLWSDCIHRREAEMAAKAAQDQAAQRAWEAESRRQYEERKQQEDAAKAAEIAKANAEFDARQKAIDREQAREEQQEKAAIAKHKADVEALKQDCGDDYKNLEVGMTIDRAKHCVAPFRMVGQIHRLDGETVSSYRYCEGYSCVSADVIRDEVVSWNRD